MTKPADPRKVESLRSELRSDLVTAEVASLIKSSLMDGLAATRDAYVACSHCGKKHLVTYPDAGVRVNAATKLLEEVEGKLAAQAESLEAKLSKATEKVQRNIEQCTQAELLLVIASGDLNSLSASIS